MCDLYSGLSSSLAIIANGHILACFVVLQVDSEGQVWKHPLVYSTDLAPIV